MSVTHPHHAQHGSHGHVQARSLSRGSRSVLLLPLLVLIGGVLLAATYVTYILWPRWPSAQIALDAPSLPITVSGVNFNIPPAAIRAKVQRKPGTQERLDLVFLWPSLTPPDPALKPGPVATPKAIDRVFLTIAGNGNTLPPIERIKTIYPRYLDSSISNGPGGLTLRPFRDGTPLSGRGPDLRSGQSRAVHRPLYARRQGRDDRHLPVRAAHRQCRHHRAFSARLAGGLEHGLERDGAVGRGLACKLALSLKAPDPLPGSPSGNCRTCRRPRRRRTARR